MFRFTIRDVLWLTVVVALAVLWQMEMRQRLVERPDLRTENVRLKKKLESTQLALEASRRLIDFQRLHEQRRSILE